MSMHSADKDKAQDHLKTLVARNKCYELLYLPQNNRVCLSIYGFWKSRSSVPAFLPDLEKVLEMVKPGFTLLIDLRTMITHPQPVVSLHVQAQKLLRGSGLLKVACVDSVDRIANLQAEDFLGQSYNPTKRFSSYSEAESWLG